jgi:hypothetical protein
VNQENLTKPPDACQVFIENPDAIETMAECYATTQDFLNHLFYGIPGPVYFELTFIAPPGVNVDGPHIVTKSYQIGAELPDWEWVESMNNAGYGVYYGLTPKKTRMPEHRRSNESNTAFCQALWVDIDLQDKTYADKDEAYNALCEHVPTAIIDSGGGWHGVWRIQPIPVNKTTLPHLKRTLRGLSIALKSDPKVAELARVFRLPGYVNTKPERAGAWCSVVSFVPGEMEYDYFEYYRELVPKQKPRLRIKRELPRDVRLSLPRWVLDYIEKGAPEGTRNNKLFGATVEYRVNGYGFSDAVRDLEPRAIADGLEPREIERTMESAWRSTVGSINVPGHLGAIMAADDAGVRDE